MSATDTAGAWNISCVPNSKTSGSRSKATNPKSNPADSPRTRWSRSLARRAKAPPAKVERAVMAASAMAIFMDRQ